MSKIQKIYQKQAQYGDSKYLYTAKDVWGKMDWDSIIGSVYPKYAIPLEKLQNDYDSVATKGFIRHRLSFAPWAFQVREGSKDYIKSLKFVPRDGEPVYFKIAGTWGKVAWLPYFKKWVEKHYGKFDFKKLKPQYDHIQVGDMLLQVRSQYDLGQPYVYKDYKSAMKGMKDYIKNNFEIK